MRSLAATAWATGLLVLTAAPGLAGDGPPTEAQEVQLVQSTLDLLGYYDGPIDGVLDAATREALERLVLDGHFAGPYDTLNQAVMNYVATFAGPALAEAFGTDPTGSWDIDLSALTPEQGQALLDLYQWESLALCASPLALSFQGMGYRPWLFGSPFVIALRDNALVPLPAPGEPDRALPGFVLIDEDTMQRTVDGRTERWHRCA